MGEGAASASASSAGPRLCHRRPRVPRPPRQAAPSASDPPRIAEAASARAEIAAMSSEAGLAGELLGKSVSIPEIEIERALGFLPLSDQACLGPVFDVADRERANADRAGSRNRRSVIVHAQALDA